MDFFGEFLGHALFTGQYIMHDFIWIITNFSHNMNEDVKFLIKFQL